MMALAKSKIDNYENYMQNNKNMILFWEILRYKNGLRSKIWKAYFLYSKYISLRRVYMHAV